MLHCLNVQAIDLRPFGGIHILHKERFVKLCSFFIIMYSFRPSLALLLSYPSFNVVNSVFSITENI